MKDTGIKLDFVQEHTGEKYKCRLLRGEYGNGRTALQLVDAKIAEAEPVAVATTNLPDVHLADGEVVIKDYAENAGVLKALRDAGVISEPLRWLSPSTLVKVPVCKLLLEEEDDDDDENGQD